MTPGRIMSKRDYYEVLGVSRSASPDEIRRAHRKLVRQYHPDMNRDNPAATEKFKEVQEAYDVLSDAQKRKQYNELGHDAFTGGAGYPPPGGDPYAGFRAGPGGSRRTWRASPNVTVEDFDMGGAGGFGDIFEQMFGAGRRGGRPGRGRPAPEPQRGTDVEHTVTLSFEQAARGCSLPLQLSRGGQLETIELKIPAGVNDGSRVRVRGKGQSSAGGAGDLYIITRVKDHPYFRRDKLDILLDVPISFYEAVLGTKLDVPTLDARVTITIPPGTNSGAKLRIKGRGIQRGEEHGDQYVVIKVVVPKDLDDEDRRLIEKLSAKHPISARSGLPW